MYSDFSEIRIRSNNDSKGQEERQARHRGVEHTVIFMALCESLECVKCPVVVTKGSEYHRVHPHEAYHLQAGLFCEENTVAKREFYSDESVDGHSGQTTYR